MKRWLCVAAFVALILIGQVLAAGLASMTNRTASGSSSIILGNWTGESICVDKEKFPACHDEQVVYRISRAANSDKVTITMDKIVDGKPENMAVLDFTYDREKGALACEFTRNDRKGVWEFAVRADSMEGTLITLPDKTIVRRIRLKKAA